jgi:thiamine pyrophosphokinase
LDTERMALWAESATHLFAVDAGFHHLESIRMLPHVIAGDFDSADLDRVPPSVKRVYLPDQNFTDFEKVLQWCFDQGYTSVHVACAEGDLPDHQLQNFFSAASSLVDVWFVFRRGMGRLVRAESGEIKVSTHVGARVSVIPLAACDWVTLRGVRWPLPRESLLPLGASSVSNRAVDTEIAVGLEQGVALLFWETNEVIWE